MQVTEHTPEIFATRPAHLFPAGLKVARGSTRERSMMLLFLLLDAAAWAGSYLALSEFTGDFNRFGWAEVLLPMIISIFTLSLIGAYDPRSETVRQCGADALTCMRSDPPTAGYVESFWVRVV